MASTSDLLRFCLLLGVCATLCRAQGWSYDEADGDGKYSSRPVAYLTTAADLRWRICCTEQLVLDGPSTWSTTFPTCGGQSQSPIDITSASSVAFTPADFVFTNYDTIPATTYQLHNTGHSAQINLNVKTVTVSGGGLTGTYTLEQLHFHWGPDPLTGAEHLLDSYSNSMEIHFVHYNSDKYTDVTNAIASGDPEGVAVFGVHVSVDPGPLSAELKTIADNLQFILYEGQSVFLNGFPVGTLLPPTAVQRDFYRYLGGLTTPECNEVVIWTVFTTPIYTEDIELAKFRSLYETLPADPAVNLDNNFRPVQAINGRVINKSSSATQKLRQEHLQLASANNE